MNNYVETKIAVIGSVSAGKSSTTGVLKHNILDDGRGLARSKIFNHQHEKDSGRTSSITYEYINYKNKVNTFIDLAGHEQYLKTTISGLLGCLVDYAMIVVGANMGITQMTREHLSIAIGLKIPIFLVMTKIDIAPKNILEETNKKIKQLVKKKSNKLIANIKTEDDVLKYAKLLQTNHIICPIFHISNKTGENLDLLKLFVKNLYPKQIVEEKQDPDSVLFCIDKTFQLKGLGCIISGTMKYGTVHVGDKLSLGPYKNETFKKVVVKSIHNCKKELVDSIDAKKTACFCIKSVNRKDIIKRDRIKFGMTLIKNPVCIRKFIAKIYILHHPTTIKKGYQPVIHCGGVKQTAIIVDMNKDCLRAGDSARVVFEFKFQAEYLELNDTIFFREGICKGIGKIIELID